MAGAEIYIAAAAHPDVRAMKTNLRLPKIIGWAIVVVVAMWPIWLWAWDVRQDRKYQLTILEPIDLLESAPEDIAERYPETNRVVGRILPGEAVAVRRMRYGKDIQIWRVRKQDGTEGWFMYNGKASVKVANGPN